MKKLLIIIPFIFCAVASFAYEKRDTFPNNQGTSNASTLFHYHGGLVSDKGFVNTRFPDTLTANLNYIKGVAGGQIIVGDTVYIRNIDTTAWITIGRFSNLGGDTLFAQRPLFFDSVTRAPNTIIKFAQANGVIGGVVTLDSCRNLSVSPGIATINFTDYSFIFTQLTIPAADPSNPRTDLVVVDTLGNVSIITGTPAATPLPPSFNPSSQFVLAQYTIGTAATCLGITQEIIYDQNTGSPEWTPTTSGSGSTNFSNTDKPYHLTIAAFTPTYTNGYKLIFTKPSGMDTVQATEILKAFVYFNGVFANQIQAQWFNGSTAVSNNIVLNPYFNSNDSNQYQLLAVPFSAWSYTSSIFNKLVITFAGNDVSGAQGLYFDWIQIQNGILNAQEPPPPAWLISGNNNTTPGANFLGTTNNQGLMFKINNVQAGFLGTTSTYNATFGIATLPFTATGIKNSAFGGAALGLSTTGFYNTALGYATLYHDTTQPYNTGVGWGSIGWNNGIGNTAVGYSSLNSTVSAVRSAIYNTSIGYEALQNNLDHSYNIGLGVQAGQLSTTVLTGVARDSTLYVSKFTKNMFFDLDSVGGTAPFTIGMDANKFWHVYSGSGGGGSETWQQTLINGSTLTQDNTVDLGENHTLNFLDNTTATSLSINTTIGDENIRMAAQDTTGDDNYGRVIVEALPDRGSFDLDASFNDDVTRARIIGQSDVSSGAIIYLADTHIINGIIQYNAPPAGASTDSVLVWNSSTNVVGMRDAASFGGGGNTIYTADDAIVSDRTVNLNSKFLKFNQGSYNPLSIDILNDTIALRVNHSSISGAFSQLKLGDSGFPNVDIQITDPSIPATGEFSQQAGTTFISNIDAGSERREDFVVSSGTISLQYQNTTTGTITSLLNSIQGADHPYITLEVTKAGGNTASIFLTDTSLNIISDLLRIRGSNGVSILNTDNTGQITFNQYGAGTFTGTPTFGLSVDASGNIIETGALGSYVHNISTPTTGGTVNLTNNQYNIINPAGALLALTVALPSSPVDNDVVYIKYTQAITTVTYSNGTVVDGITSPIAGGLLILVFNSGDSKWY